MIKKINHIAIVVHSIEEALQVYEGAWGLECTEIEEVPEQAVNIACLSVGESEIELVQPITTDSGVAKFLEKRGEGFHHICYEVDDINEEVSSLKAAGMEILGGPRPGAEGMSVFLHPRGTHGVLVELVEKK